MLTDITKPDAQEMAQLLAGTLTTDNMWWAWWDGIRNFGDWIGPYLYVSRTGRTPRYCAPGHVPEGVEVLFTCGSIIQRIRKKNRAVIWGSGIKRPGDFFMQPKAIHAVRGPLTQEVIARRGFAVPDVLGDPGLCLPRYYQPQSRERQYRVGIIPHVYDQPFWDRNRDMLPDDCLLIDLTLPVERVIDLIVSCEATLSTSLHGIIESHAYGVPSGWMASFHPELKDDFKFRDYFLSVGLDLTKRDRRKISLPFDLGDYRSDLTLPARDIAAMADLLLERCPF